MTIGRLLKKYRLEQGKTQVEFVGSILSRSYYAKVENGVHQINANDLIDVLDYNNIDLVGFFTQLNEKYESYKDQILHQRRLMEEAYYKVDINQMRKIKCIVENSELSQVDKDKQNLLIDGFMELLDVDGEPNVSLRRKIKETLFNMPEFNQTKFMLYCNSMRFYSLEDNNIIVKRLIRSYGDSENIDIQKDILSMVINVLVFSIEQNNLSYAEFYFAYVAKIPTIPDTFFYKNVVKFFEYLIKYKQSGRKDFLEKCDLIIENINISDMENYSSELNKFKNKYQ